MRVSLSKILLFAGLLLCGAGLRAQSPAPISPEAGERFGRLWVQSPQGRPEPVDTYSGELLRKITRRGHYDSLDANRWLLGLLAEPDYWKTPPLVYLGDKALRERFSAGDKRAPFDAFFDREGHYLLSGEIEAAYAKPVAERNKSDKELLKTDERINILHALTSGRMLPLFPDANARGWHSAGDSSAARPAEAALLNALLTSLREGRGVETDTLFSMIEAFQSSHAAALHLSERKKEAECFYNRADFFRTSFRGYLLLGFLLALCCLLPASPSRRKLILVWSLGIGLLFLWQSAGMALRGYISGRAPWANAYETMVYVGWSTVLAGGLLSRRQPLVLALSALMGGVILFVSNLNWLDPQITPLVPVLQSPWLMIHVSVVTASYGFFGIGTLCALASLAALALHRENPALRPVGELALWIGLVLLTAGIFAGAVWANESWGRYWGWDPKETWALITMLYYALVLHARFIPKFNNDYAFNLLTIGGIYLVLMTFFGVNYLLSGLHAYGHSGGISLWPLGVATVLIAALALAAGLQRRKP